MKKLLKKIDEAIRRGELARKGILLNSALPEADRIQIADEILYMVDDLESIRCRVMAVGKELESAWNLSAHNSYSLL